MLLCIRSFHPPHLPEAAPLGCIFLYWCFSAAQKPASTPLETAARQAASAACAARSGRQYSLLLLFFCAQCRLSCAVLPARQAAHTGPELARGRKTRLCCSRAPSLACIIPMYWNTRPAPRPLERGLCPGVRPGFVTNSLVTILWAGMFLETALLLISCV